MTKNFLRSLAAVTFALGILSLGALAYSTATQNSQGPVFNGAPTVPGLNFTSTVTVTPCVTDGGFNNCVAQAQVVGPVSIIQSFQVPADGGSGFEAFISAQPNGTLALTDGGLSAMTDGGSWLPGLTVGSYIQVQPVQLGTVTNSIGCGVSNDGGQVVVACDGGIVVNVLRVN